MIRRWTVRSVSLGRKGDPCVVYTYATGGRFLTRHFAQQEANRLNSQLTERSPADVLYKAVAIYLPGPFDRLTAPYRSWRRNRFLAKVADRLRKVAP